MTDTVTEMPAVLVGQTWLHKGYSRLRDAVVAMVDVEGTTFVGHRGTNDDRGCRIQWTDLASFHGWFESPKWPTPDPVGGYAPVILDDHGALHVGALLRDDPEDAAVAKGAIGVVRVTTTYEWVRAGELEGGE